MCSFLPGKDEQPAGPMGWRVVLVPGRTPMSATEWIDVDQERDPWGRAPYWLMDRVQPSAFVVYVAVTRYVGMGDGCGPSIERLAVDTGLSRSTVKRGLDELESVGAVKVEHRYVHGDKGQGRLPSRYWLRTSEPKGCAAGEPTPDRGGCAAGEPRGGVTGDPRVGSLVNPEIEPGDRTKKIEGEGDAADDSQALLDELDAQHAADSLCRLIDRQLTDRDYRTLVDRLQQIPYDQRAQIVGDAYLEPPRRVRHPLRFLLARIDDADDRQEAS